MAPLRVAVVGCGVMGAATGWRLSRRGVEVTCFDRHSPPHTLGSSHGESRITRTAYFEGSWYVPLLQETFPMWRDLEAATGSRVLTMTGLLMIGAPGTASVSGSTAVAKQHGLEIELLDADEIRHGFPGHVVTDDEVGVLDPQAGYLRADEAVEAMCRGLDVRRNVTVTRLVSRPDAVEVITPQGSEAFDASVVAVGPWVRDLVPWLPVTVERQVLVWLANESGAGWLAPERFPVWYHEDLKHGDVYGFPSLDGRSVKLARHHGGEVTTADSVRRRVDDADLDPLRLFATQCLRGVTRHVTRSAVCMYTNTPDQHFVVDLLPDDPRIVLVSACSGHGFKFAPVIGDIAADLACDRGTLRDISRFSLARFAKPAV